MSAETATDDLIGDAFERGVEVGKIEAQRSADWALYLEGLKVGYTLGQRLASDDPKVREEIRDELRALVDRFYPDLTNAPSTSEVTTKVEPAGDPAPNGRLRTRRIG